MTNKFSVFRYVAVLFAPLAALITVILRAILLLRDYDPNTGYYRPGTALPSAFPYVLVAVFLLFFIAALILRGRFTIPRSGGLSVLFASAFLLITLLVAAVCALLTLPRTDGYERFFLSASVFASLFSILYLVLTMWGDRAESVTRAMLALGGAFYGLFLAITLYFDSTLGINVPPKVYHLVAYLAVAVFFVSECRHMLARTKPALHYFVCSVALVLTASASLPNLLYTLLRGTTLVLNTVNDFLLFAAFLYILARLLQCLPQDDNAVSPLVGLIAVRPEEDLPADDAEETPAEEAPAEAPAETPTEDAPAAPAAE